MSYFSPLATVEEVTHNMELKVQVQQSLCWNDESLKWGHRYSIFLIWKRENDSWFFVSQTETYRYKKIINWSWWIYFSSAWATFAVILLHLTKQAVWVSLPVALATAHAEFNDLGTNRVIACYYSSCLRQSKEGWEGEDGRNKPKKRWGLLGQPPEEGAVLRCATVSRHS